MKCEQSNATSVAEQPSFDDSGKNKIFSSGFMWLIGIIASTLFAAGINGGPILMVAPLWVIYIFVNSIFYFGSWASYSKFLSNMLYEDPVGALI